MGNEVKRNFVITSIIENYVNKNFVYSELSEMPKPALKNKKRLKND